MAPPDSRPGQDLQLSSMENTSIPPVNPLEGLGIKFGSDVQHSVMADLRLFPAEDFFEQAEILVARASPIVLREIVPHLEDFPGRWNPGGFMVFPLGLHDVLGSLRLHVYPRGIPRETAQGPNIHNHAWHLFSRVLVGSYTDTLYALERIRRATDPEAAHPESGLLRVFETRRNPGGRDRLVTDGALVRAVPLIDRQASAGQVHTIEADVVYHLPTVSPEQLTATLVLDSQAFAVSTHVLLDSASLRIDRTRTPVDRSSALLAKAQMMGSMKSE